MGTKSLIEAIALVRDGYNLKVLTRLKLTDGTSEAR